MTEKNHPRKLLRRLSILAILHTFLTTGFGCWVACWVRATWSVDTFHDFGRSTAGAFIKANLALNRGDHHEGDGKDDQGGQDGVLHVWNKEWAERRGLLVLFSGKSFWARNKKRFVALFSWYFFMWRSLLFFTGFACTYAHYHHLDTGAGVWSMVAATFTLSYFFIIFCLPLAEFTYSPIILNLPMRWHRRYTRVL